MTRVVFLIAILVCSSSYAQYIPPKRQAVILPPVILPAPYYYARGYYRSGTLNRTSLNSRYGYAPIYPGKSALERRMYEANRAYYRQKNAEKKAAAKSVE
jgi:hypothetical protein